MRRMTPGTDDPETDGAETDGPEMEECRDGEKTEMDVPDAEGVIIKHSRRL